MILNKIDDPRDNLERAKLLELVRFANANGLDHINYDMPAMLIRAELRSRGMTNIRVPSRPLGSTSHPQAIANATQDKNVVQVQAIADLARQFAQQQAAPSPPPLGRTRAKPEKPPRLVERPKQEINVLRDQCKALGIKMDRRDNKAALKAKIAAHGQNAPQ